MMMMMKKIMMMIMIMARMSVMMQNNTPNAAIESQPMSLNTLMYCAGLVFSQRNESAIRRPRRVTASVAFHAKGWAPAPLGAS